MTEQKPEHAKQGNLFQGDAGIYTVSELTKHLQQVIKQDPVLGDDLTVQGELSNVKRSSRGHIYFTLKDAESGLSGILWASTAKRLQFDLEEGLDVYATGSLRLYAPNGTYSLVVDKLVPVGMGALQLAFQQLKEKLEAEGLFLPEHKQPLPDFPKRIGLITAQTGAVIHDMLRVLRRKNPLVDILLFPVSVQGQGAADSIAQAVREANRPGYELDLLIVGRGGGSFEDLFCFSEEPVVRAIFDSQLPVIAGIGHEPDYGLADAVADLSASTPTAAAESAVPDVAMLWNWVEDAQQSFLAAMESTLLFHEQRLDHLTTGLLDRHQQWMETAQQRVDRQREQLIHRMEARLQQGDAQQESQATALNAFNPLTTLGRGYALVSGEKGDVIRSITETHVGQPITITVSDGFIYCEVKETHERASIPATT